MSSNDEVEFLAELSRTVASNADLQSVLEWIVTRTPSQLSADGGSIKLTGDGDVTVSMIRRVDGIGSWPSAVTTSVAGYLQIRSDPLVTPDLLADPRFSGLERVGSPVRAVLAVPLKVGNRMIGMLGVGCRAPGRSWSREEVRFMEIVAAHSGEVLELIRQRHKADELRADTQAAGKVQQRLVPAETLRSGAWEVAGRLIPARDAGGDYFDYFPLDRDRFTVAIADVVGKGLKAAMMVSSISVLVRTGCDGRRPLAEAVANMNRYLAGHSQPDEFATLFVAEFDTRRGLLHYVRAGHDPPLVRRTDGTIEALLEGQPPIGVFEQATYQEEQVRLEPGDALLLYTDGMVDALAPDDTFFGEDRLRAVWERCAGYSPHKALDRILREVKSFRGNMPQNDDIAIVVLGSPPIPA